MSAGVLWLIAAIVLLILEVFTGTFVILWLGIAAGIAGLFAFFARGWVPWVVFVIASAVLLWVSRPLAHRLRGHSPAKTNVDAVIGQDAMVIETIDPVANTGRVRVASDQWRARAEGVVETGRRVRVVGITGTTLKVEPLDE
jgi:membrane protein implicated in regulation of membrane protease activity